MKPLSYKSHLKMPARSLRGNMTPAEHALWSRIRRDQILGARFYRQKPIGSYIVDFYCHRAKLVIEIDGGQHWEPAHVEADRVRDANLGTLGLKVLRYSNRDIAERIDPVLEEILAVVKERVDS